MAMGPCLPKTNHCVLAFAVLPWIQAWGPPVIHCLGGSSLAGSSLQLRH
jgi:hypothetical protein